MLRSRENWVVITKKQERKNIIHGPLELPYSYLDIIKSFFFFTKVWCSILIVTIWIINIHKVIIWSSEFSFLKIETYLGFLKSWHHLSQFQCMAIKTTEYEFISSLTNITIYCVKVPYPKWAQRYMYLCVCLQTTESGRHKAAHHVSVLAQQGN